MTNLSLTSNFDRSESSPFDAIRGYRADGSEYWTARELTKWLGYTNWRNGEKAIDRAIASCQNQGFDATENIVRTIKLSTRHRGAVVEIEDYELSRFACYLVAMNADPEKEMVAMAQGYFALQTRKAEVVIPVQNDRIRELELEVQVLQLRKDVTLMQDARLALHGFQTLLMLEGRPDAIVTIEVPVTEVVNFSENTTDRILSAEQLKAEVKKRTGQNLKSMKQFTDALRKAGRDDLMVPVTRAATSEYITPERLDEAIGIVYGKSRQGLIGQ
jgi:hypothetical protein